MKCIFYWLIHLIIKLMKSIFFVCGLWKESHRFRLGLLGLDTIAILGQGILHCGGCPVCCRTFSSIPGLCPLDASIIYSTNCGNQKCVQTLCSIPWGTKWPVVENHWVKRINTIKVIDILGAFFMSVTAQSTSVILNYLILKWKTGIIAAMLEIRKYNLRS